MIARRKLLLSILVPLLIIAGAAIESLLPAFKYYDRFPTARSINLSDKDTLRFLDLGTGVGAVLRTKEGHHILIDTGEDPGASRMQTELRYLNAQKIDHVILTSPTAEHVSGIGTLAQMYPIGRILYPELSAKQFQLQQYESAKTIPQLKLRADDEYLLGNGISLRIFYPRQPIFDTLRDASLVVQLKFKDTRILFTGDLSKEAMDALLDLPLESDILVVPNHARAGSLTEGFLKKVNPRIAVITGIQKGVQPPDENLVEQLSESWIEVYRTDRQGTVTVVFSNKSFEILGP